MRTNPKFISLVISLLVTMLVVVTVQIGSTQPSWPWVLTAGITMVLTFLISLGVLELLLFKEIKKVSEVLLRLSSKAPFQETRALTKPNFDDLLKLVTSYTKIKQLEIDQLKSTAAYRREFLADISHELKTPIFAAQGYLHTLLDGAIDDSSVKMRFLKKATKSLDGLDALVQDLLVLSSLETGQVTMDIQPFNIYELSVDVFEQLEDKAHKKNIKLGLGSGVYKNIMVLADQQRIMQILQNLILNGINYTEEGGKVTVDFETKKDRVVVHVIDNGIGILTEHLDRIFQRFYRVEKSRGKSHYRGGTGLGLAIVKHILEQHQSQIKVKSNINKGSDFYFELPNAK